MYKNLKTVTLFGLFVFLLAMSWPKTESTAAAPIMESITWVGEDFAQGSGMDTAVSPSSGSGNLPNTSSGVRYGSRPDNCGRPSGR